MDLWLTLAVFGTALLSGVFGMAGGLLLLLLLALRMPLPEALVVFGVAQLMSNGLRAVLSARHVRLRVLGPYALASALTLLVCSTLQPALSTAAALTITGLSPWLEPMFARARLPSIERPLGALGCGALVTGLHFTAGVAGPLLDQFFLGTSLTRHQIVATKAITQCLGHAMKIVYFGPLTGAAPSLNPRDWPALALASIVGTVAGRLILDRVDEKFFRRASRRLVRCLGLACLARAAWLTVFGVELTGQGEDP